MVCDLVYKILSLKQESNQCLLNQNIIQFTSIPYELIYVVKG